MNFFKNKFFVSVLILSVTIFLLSAPTAQAGFFDFFSDFLGTILIIAVVAVAVVTQQYWVPLVFGAAGGVGAGVAAVYLAEFSTLGLIAAFGTAEILIVGGILTGLVACAEGLICPGGQSSGLLLTAVSSDMGCTYQIPMTFYSWQSDVYGYPAFKYDYGEGDNANTGFVNSKALFKNSNCTNSVTDPYSSDNRYAMVSPPGGNVTCTPIYPSNIFKYISGYK